MENQLIKYIVFSIFLSGGLYDLLCYRIPNLIPALIVLLFPIVLMLDAANADWVMHVFAFFLMLAVGMVLFRFSILGGGDVKFMSSIALWTGFDHLVTFLFLVAILGGLLSVFILFGRLVCQVLYKRGMIEKVPDIKLLAPGEGVPYGVAISGAGILVFMGFPQGIGFA